MPHYTLTLSGRDALLAAAALLVIGFICGRLF
jgi:hypothetical protein